MRRESAVDGNGVRGGTLLFFGIALGFTWILQLPAVLAQRGWLGVPLQVCVLPAAIGGFGPLVAAIVASRVEEGPGAWSRLGAALRVGGVRPAWYLVAAGLFWAIYLAAVALYALAVGHAPGPLGYPPENAGQIVAMLVVPFAEEPGWRWFALPRLQARHSSVAASAIVGAGWALYHTMMFLLAGLTPALFAWSMGMVFAASFVFTWLHDRTRGSLLVMILAHAGVHANNPTHALPTHPTPFVLYTIAIAVVACGLTAFRARD